MSFSKRPGKNTPQCYTKPLDSLKNWNNLFFWVDERVFPTVVDWRESAPKDEKPAEGCYSVEDVARLDTRSTPIQKQPEALLCLVGLSWRYYLGDDVYPTFLYDDGREMDLFNLIRALNPAKVKTGTRPRAAHEVLLLTVTTNRVIDMGEPAAATESSGTPSTIERSPLDFSNKNPSQPINEGDETEDQVLEIGASEVPPIGHASTTGVAPNIVIEEEDAADVPLVSKRRRSRVNDGANANALPKVLRKDFDVSRPAPSTFGGKSFASTGLEAGSTLSAPASQGTPAGTIVQDPLSFTEPQPALAQDIAESSKGATVAGVPDSAKSSSFTSFAGSPGGIYQPGWGITNSCRFDTPGACQDAVDYMVPPGFFSELRHLPNEEFLNEYNESRDPAGGRVDMKKAAKANSAELTRELESLRAKFTDLQVNNNQLFQQVSTLQAQVTSKEQIKVAFEEFKKREDEKVERRCAEMEARLDALSVDFDEELYPHMPPIGYQTRSTPSRNEMCGIHRPEACLDLEVIEAYDPEADAKYVVALYALKDLEYPLIDHPEKLKDDPIDLIMASLHLESDVGEETPQWIHELRPSSSQLKIYVYPEVHDLRDPWAFKEEMMLEDAIMANGLAILLTDASTRTKTTEDEASPRLIRSKSLLPMYNLDWP
ncbi:hypothetical protein Tco_0873763 [Tanacetum coccineum]|uniref:Transposase (Putative), gypsy type n=1 Tax=Tanacetum coccineum TaxID=301880 RepID=A0ABQ5BMP0_9ASTR